jgi:hypothetical protein
MSDNLLICLLKEWVVKVNDYCRFRGSAGHQMLSADSVLKATAFEDTASFELCHMFWSFLNLP